MAKKKKVKKPGLYWHVYHNDLLAWCWDYYERRSYILKYKPKSERPTRLKYFQPIKGRLPIGLGKLLAVAKNAQKAFEKAEEAYKRADQAYEKAAGVRNNADLACDKAEDAIDNAGDKISCALKQHRDKLEALHAKEHPSCPWNGSRLIFSRKRKKKTKKKKKK